MLGSLEYEYAGASLGYEYAGASLEYEYAGAPLVVAEGADESVIKLIVPPTWNDSVPVCVMKDTDCVGEAVVTGASDEVEPIMYPTEDEIASSEAEVEVDTGIGENGWVVNVTRLGAVAVPCAMELSETPVVEHSVGVTITVVVKRVVNLPFAAEEATLVEIVPELSSASVTVAVEYVVEVPMAVGKSVVSGPLTVEVAAAASVVVVENFSEKASPSGMLIPGMSEASGVLVTVGR
jgi:hypothetical protein